MIDVEKQVYTQVVRAVQAEYPKILHTNKYESLPSEFPAVKVSEISNVEAPQLHDSSNDENGALLTYQVDAYADMRENGARAEAKRIASLADDAMRLMGFERTYGQSAEEQTKKASSVHFLTRYMGIASVRPKETEEGEDQVTIYRRF